MKILGINAFHPDSSACIVVDGKIIVAIEEERIRRIKHWAGFPSLSIEACLNQSDIDFNDLDYIAINRDANAHIFEKIKFTMKNRPALKSILNRVGNRKNIGDISSLLCKQFLSQESEVNKKIKYVEHHIAHLSSTYHTSPFSNAVCLSVDGFGDFVSTMWGKGTNEKIIVEDYVGFPNSLGLLYQAITQFLGFDNYGDEYKVMGMAAYGSPKYLKEMGEIISLENDGKFILNPDYFLHLKENISMEFSDGYPKIGKVYNDKMIELFGAKRGPDDEIEQKHKDIAASLQRQYEIVLFHILEHLNFLYPDVKKLCLAGGCAQNSLANGKITSVTKFDEVWIQPAAGDAGGALGAALYLNSLKSKSKHSKMVSPGLGLKYSEENIKDALATIEDDNRYKITYFENENLISKIVDSLEDSNVIGFFNGGFEWGPRALGNRSIIVDARLKNMQSILNEKIKKRESFRPFAPSVLEEYSNEWFESKEPVPFMTHVFKIKPDKRSLIPAVTHFDGTGRLQTVSSDQNFMYYSIILEFYKRTGVPMILNTSFNENEPIVNTPLEAINCFTRTKMDVVVIENFFVERL